MTKRRASCACGQLSADCAGDPVRVSICHCLACRQRTGSAFSWNARFPVEAVTITGNAASFMRRGDEGSEITYRFCPACGVTVYYGIDVFPDMIAIPVGAFASTDVPPPTVSVYHDRHPEWLDINADPLTVVT